MFNKERKLPWDATVDDFKYINKLTNGRAAWAECDDRFTVEAGESEKK